VEAAYDIPPDAWYFNENGARTMPFAVLLEAALQPCGWLATSVGCPLLAAQEVFFRNLDGTAVQHRELTPESGRLTTRATLTSVSILGPMTLVNFDVSCEAGGESIITLKTGFGFFPEAALANQVGLPMTPAERSQATQPGTIDLDLASRPASLFGGTARLADGKLLMLDRITGHWPDAGRAGLGIIRGTKAVDPREWFFKAHFFQDPVQPGSLGVEALLQLLQAAMLRDGMAEGIPGARFEPLALGQETVWRYRGQVVPRNQTITTVVEVLERGRDERGAYAIAEGVLLVDGRKIYHLPRFGMRIVPGAEPPPDRRSHAEERFLDPARDTWLVDHCPTYVIPVVPMMVTVDILADAASRVAGGRLVVGLHGLKLRGWIAFPDGPRRLRIEAERDDAGRVTLRLLAWREARVAAMSRFDVVATATAELADAWPDAPAPWPAISGGVQVHGPARDMYDAGGTFHGPSFRRIMSLHWEAGEGSAVIDADPGSVPSLLLNPLLLDSTAQAIVSDTIGRLDTSLPADMVCFPSELERIVLHGPAPSSGAVRAALRYHGRRAEDPRFLRFGVQIIEGGRVWAELDLTEVMFRKGRLVGASATDRRDLALRRRPVPGMTISTLAGGTTLATTDDVGGADWFPGTVGRIYGIDATEPAALRRMVAVKDHMATSWGVHPSTVTLDGSTARSAALPFLSRPLAIRDTADATHVADAGPDTMDRQALADFWMPGLGGPRNAIIQVLDELCALFLRQLRLDDPAGIAAIHGRPVLLLGNHQVHLESVMFSELIAPVLGSKVVTVSRTEHRTSWIGATATLAAGFPGAGPHEPIVFFDRADPADMLRLLADYRTRLLPQGRSLMVHVTGEVALSCREAVTRVSSVLLDLAVDCGLPIVPVRFMGALPVAPLQQTVTFPAGFSRQDIALGAPIMPDELQGLRLVERGRRVIDAINGIAPEPSREAPLPPRPELAARVGARMAAGQAEVTAVLAKAMDAVAMREPALAAFARGEVPAGWHGAELEWGQAFIGWLRGG
jgi:3-hydroxymyristoyl/3-hydroxydecanoyl-(acyl carrier protein) dehydratase